MADTETLARIAALEEQVGRLAARLKSLENGIPPVPQSAPAPVLSKFPTAPPSPRPPFVQPISGVSTQPPDAPPLRPSAASPKRAGNDFEATIGKNWASWIGALLLLLGVCFFLKYAWDHQWIHPTPIMRLITAVLLGFIVGGIGEWTFRRKMKSLAGACFGGAISIIMASFFGGATLFAANQRPITPTGALVAVAITALAGVAVALRTSTSIPAVIALIGAFLAPFVLNTGADHSLGFLIYLSIVCAVAWILDVWRWKWVEVRLTGLLGGWITFLIWQSEVGSSHQTLAVVFAVFFFLAFHCDTVGCTLNQARATADLILGRLENSSAILSVLNTAFAFIAFYQIFSTQSLHYVGVAAVLMALAHILATSWSSAGSMRLSSRLQAAALVTISVPLLLGHFAVTGAWGLMALVICILSWKLDLKWLYGWSIALWSLAVLHLLCNDEFQHHLTVHWFDLGHLAVSRGVLMGWGLAVLAHIVANLRPNSLRKNNPPYGSPVQILTALGTLLFLAITPAISDPDWTFAALIWAGAILTLSPILQLDYAGHLLILLLLITGKWMAADALAPTFDSWDRVFGAIGIPVFNRAALAGALLCILLGGWISQLRRTGLKSRYLAARAKSFLETGMPIWVGGIIFILASVEMCRFVDFYAGAAEPVIKQVALSVLWGIIGLASVFVGFSRRIAPLRYAALILLGVTLVKILIIDMAQVQAIWRILSFLGVGALLLGVSYIYHKQSAGSISVGG